MDWFVRFLLPPVVLLIAALMYEVIRSARGHRVASTPLERGMPYSRDFRRRLCLERARGLAEGVD